MEYFYIFILNEYLTNTLGTHYPREIIMLIMMMFPRMIKISCGAYYNILSSESKIYAWGSNGYGQLGLGDCNDKLSPTEIKIGICLDNNIELITCGWDFTIVTISNSKIIYKWGSDKPNKICSPTKLILDIDSNIKSISCGQSHIFILTQSIPDSGSKCYSLGLNNYGQAGLGHANYIDSPQEIMSLPPDIVRIVYGPGSLHIIAIAKSGKCYTWGRNHHGQLGLGHYVDMLLPQELGPPLQNIIAISSGYAHTIATILDTNKIYVWGNNDEGQLGLGDHTTQNSPKELLFRTCLKIESVSCGLDHTMALTTRGTIYIWGGNDSGQLGLGDTLNKNFPHELRLRESIKSIYCGNYHTICVTLIGKIYVWGANRCGQLGLGDKEDRFTPSELVFFYDR